MSRSFKRYEEDFFVSKEEKKKARREKKQEKKRKKGEEKMNISMNINEVEKKIEALDEEVNNAVNETITFINENIIDVIENNDVEETKKGEEKMNMNERMENMAKEAINNCEKNFKILEDITNGNMKKQKNNKLLWIGGTVLLAVAAVVSYKYLAHEETVELI